MTMDVDVVGLLSFSYSAAAAVATTALVLVVDATTMDAVPSSGLS